MTETTPINELYLPGQDRGLLLRPLLRLPLLPG
jgi:hypothetical protein